MGLFPETFNSGSRGVLCKTWVQKILHTNNVKEVQKFFFRPELQLLCFTTKNIQRTELRLNTLSPRAGGMIHEDAKVTLIWNTCTYFFFSIGETRLFLQGRDRINQSWKWTWRRQLPLNFLIKGSFPMVGKRNKIPPMACSGAAVKLSWYLPTLSTEQLSGTAGVQVHREIWL